MSKKSWMRLLGFCRFGSEAERHAKFKLLFLTHHQESNEMVHSKGGEPLAAVYFNYESLHRIETKAIMRSIQERILYAYEQEELTPEAMVEKAAMEIIKSLPLYGGCAMLDPFHMRDLKDKISSTFSALLKYNKPEAGTDTEVKC